MPSVRQLAIHDSPRALTGGLRTDFDSLLCEIHTSSTKTLNSLHTRGKVLFAEVEPAAGIFILRTGRATESISSSEGRVVILRIRGKQYLAGERTYAVRKIFGADWQKIVSSQELGNKNTTLFKKKLGEG